MKVLLTGATGFLGSEVLRRLLAGDDTVTALVRGEPGEAARRLGAAGRSERVRVVPGDLADEDALGDACEGADVAIHLAGALKPEDDLEEANADGTRSLVDACTAAGVRRVVLAGTVAVYGLQHPPWAWPLDEDSPLEGSSRYARSKAAAEQILREAASDAQREWVVLRLSTVYGPGSPSFARMVRAVVAQPVRAANRAAHTTLQPLHVRDAAEAFLLAAAAPGARQAILNVAGGEHVTHRAWVRTIRRALELVPADAGWQPDALPELKYDIRAAKAQLGLTPRVGIEEGVEEAVRALDDELPARPLGFRAPARGRRPARRLPREGMAPAGAARWWR